MGGSGMSDTFKPVKLSKIAKAFSCAHQYAEHGESRQDRARFRHVAKLIWDACGEELPMPEELPENLRTLADAVFLVPEGRQ
jgi:hypothetical protein